MACVVNFYGPSDFTKSYGKRVDAAEVLPLWLGGDPKYTSMLAVDAEPALAAGLEPRPLPDTIRDTLAWVVSGESPPEPPAGLAHDKEERVLAAWDARA